MAILYVIGNEILSPIVESQVFRPLAAEAPPGERFVVALLPIGLLLRPRQRTSVRDTLVRLTRQYGVTVYPSYARLSHRSSAWIDACAVRRVMRRLLARFPRLEVRGRNAHATATALAAARPLKPRPPVTYDCRGDQAAELVGKFGVTSAAAIEASADIARVYRDAMAVMAPACAADRIIVVSQAMGQMLHDRHEADLGRMTVRPCAVDLAVFPTPDPERARRQLGLANRFVVCYLGSLEWYQLPDQSIRLFRLMHARARDAFFLSVTTAPAKMQQMLEAVGVARDDFRVVKAAPGEVPQYVSAAHVGLLLREDNPVNAVASPVKFAEYLACGVPVLITPHVGDYSGIVQAEGLGYQVDLDAADDLLSNSLAKTVAAVRADREISPRCRRYAEQHLAWSAPRHEAGGT